VTIIKDCTRGITLLTDTKHRAASLRQQSYLFADVSVSTVSGMVCRRKQLQGLGHRLLDRFKQQYEQKKKRRKEKRNSTKKELREDGIVSIIIIITIYLLKISIKVVFSLAEFLFCELDTISAVHLECCGTNI